MPNKNHQPIAACSVALQGNGTAVQIFPAGRFSIPHGAMMGSGNWQMDAPAAAALIAKVSALKNEILVDYEHQTLLTDKNGKPNPAAGWLRREADAWEWRPGVGLFHRDPKWTPAAAKSIAEDEYRYLSAVFSFDEVTGYPIEIYHVALTNTPAIDGMAPVVAALTAKQSGNKPPAGGDDVPSKAPVEDVCKAEWRKSAALRAEFGGDLDSYIAYTKAVNNGRVRLYSRKSYLDTVKPAAALTATQTDNKPPAGGKGAPSEAPLEDVCKADWSKSAALRAEFGGDLDSYIAYTKAVSNGQVRLYSSVKRG